MIWGLAGGTIIIVFIGIGVLFGGAPFVPTRRRWLKEAMQLAEIKPDDVLVDLGSGDGSALAAAVEAGASRAIGYEISPILVWWSRLKLRKLKSKAKVMNVNLWKTKMPKDTTVIYVFQAGPVLKRLDKYLQEQRPYIETPKLRVICFGFEIPSLTLARSLNGMMLYEI
mgnify:CR=1 FL=1